MNPRANRLVERQNRTVKAAIRKFIGYSPDTRWWEVLPDIACAIRVLPTRATNASPYLLVYKQEPPLALPNTLRGLTEEEFVEQTENNINAEVGYWEQVFADMRRRHNKYDKEMVEAYLRR